MSISSDDSFDDDNILLDTAEDINYYAILNIPKDASIEEINKAYKHRCLIFHPDRHINEDDKKEAAKIFVLLRQAYETLSDPQKRFIYDTVGASGLEVGSWQLVQRSTNPENIRKEYEFLKRLREKEIMLQRVHPTSGLVFKVSLAGLFQENPVERYPPQVLGMSISQGIESLMTPTDKVGLSGRAQTLNGQGNCLITAHYQKNIGSMYHIDNSIELTADSVSLGTKLLRTLGQRASIAVCPSIGYLTLTEDYFLSLMCMFTIQLRQNLHGSLTLNCGPTGSSLTTTILKTELNQNKCLATLTVALNPSIRVVYNLRYPEFKDLHYEVACTAGLFGLAPSLSMERRLTKYSKVGASIYLAFPACLLHAKLKLKTSLNNFEVQFTLCDNADDIARSTIYGVLLPLLVTNVVRVIFKRPLARLMRLFEDRSEDDQVNECRKEEALRIVHLMGGSAEKIRREEERKNGLVIVEAHYGQLADDVLGAEQYPVAGERLIDVTIPMQTLVNDSQLRIFSTKDQLPGFYDPCPGQPKVLRVVYKFRGELHSVTVNDDQALNIPLKAHLIQA